MTSAFTVTNCIYVPVAYIRHTLSLIETLTDSDETMDDFDEKFRRFQTIIKFAFLAPFILVFSVPIDMGVYFYNLYTRPVGEEAGPDIDLISKKALEVFEVCLTETLRDHRKATGQMGDTKVEFV